MNTRFSAVLFDVDGTLVDSNDAHSAAWVRAFAEAGIQVDPIQVRRAIGMGGDKLIPAVSGIDAGSSLGRQIAQRRGDIFKNDFLPQLHAFHNADRLVAALRDRGFTLVAASSAKRDELSSLLKIAGADALLHDSTSADDAAESKPDPDIIDAALGRAETPPHQAVMIGDTPYDVDAARRAGVSTIAFRCGGWPDEDLKGALAIYDGPWDLLQRLQGSPLVSPC